MLMANIIPKLSDDEIKRIPSFAEQKLYKALSQDLPANYLVVHSLEFIRKNLKDESHGDREADFVIFSPDAGVLVVEVKGGGIRRDKSVDKWFSIDRFQKEHETNNPVRQAKNAKYEISNHLQKKLGKKKLILAHAVMFPDIQNCTSLASPELVKDIIGVHKEVSNIHSWVLKVFEFWAGKSTDSDLLGIHGVKVAEEIYGNTVQIMPSLRSMIEKEIQQQLELTKQQMGVLRQLKRRKEALIEGGAGTGKTVLATDHAINLSAQGLKVLLLCYNQKLGNSLKLKTENINNLDAMNFHEFCSWRIRQADKNAKRDLISESEKMYPNSNLYSVHMPNGLINSYDIAPIKYDVIIIDEGQDFTPEYWFAIELLKDQNEDLKLYIFQDCNQAIYTDTSDLPITCEPLYLFDNCRNTKFIHDSAYRYYMGADVEAPEIIGEPIQLVSKESFQQQANEIGRVVSKLVNAEGIKPKDIVVTTIGSFDVAKSNLLHTKHNDLWSFKTYSNRSKVLVETAKRFKGLESKILILWVLDSSQATEKMLYVSISRARFRLWIVGEGNFLGQMQE
jgi:hypothetical protein